MKVSIRADTLPGKDHWDVDQWMGILNFMFNFEVKILAKYLKNHHRSADEGNSDTCLLGRQMF